MQFNGHENVCAMKLLGFDVNVEQLQGSHSYFKAKVSVGKRYPVRLADVSDEYLEGVMGQVYDAVETAPMSAKDISKQANSLKYTGCFEGLHALIQERKFG